MVEQEDNIVIQPQDRRPIRVRFLDRGEVRMGSPYNLCRVSLSGDWVPELPGGGEDYQDLKAWSPDGEHLVLVRWDSEGNEPSFRLVVVAFADRVVYESVVQPGCCASIGWEDGSIRYRTSFGGEGSIRPKE